MKLDWKHILGIALTILVWIAYGLSKGPLPEIGAYLPGALALLAPVWTWIGMASPKVFGAVVLFLVLGSSTGCSFFQSPQGAATITAGVDLAVCVLNHSQEPIQQIVTDCGASTAADVIKILDAHKAAMTRESAK